MSITDDVEPDVGDVTHADLGSATGATSVVAIPRIDLADADRRFETIADEVWSAATGLGFFEIENHGIPPVQIEAAFASAQEFFALPEDTKARRAMVPGSNAGWDDRPLATDDRHEVFQITLPRMDEYRLWPDTAFPSFRREMTAFAQANHRLALQVLSMIAARLEWPRDFFERRHDLRSPYFQSMLRLRHHPPMPESLEPQPGVVHTDTACVTLLHRRRDDDGLQVRSGPDPDGGPWLPVPATPGTVVCNVGDMLRRWTGDRVVSAPHRVVAPAGATLPRYAIAYFCQADEDVVIDAADDVHPPITAGRFLQRHLDPPPTP